jgi:hypothetical protein
MLKINLMKLSKTTESQYRLIPNMQQPIITWVKTIEWKNKYYKNVKVASFVDKNIFVRSEEKSWLEFRIKIAKIQFLSTFRKLYNYYLYEN